MKLDDHDTDYSEGDKLFLVCISDGFPQAKIEWLRNDQPLPYSDRVVMQGTPNHTICTRLGTSNPQTICTCKVRPTLKLSVHGCELLASPLINTTCIPTTPSPTDILCEGLYFCKFLKLSYPRN